jgi:5,10-methylenetetrahydromethanopterin reductase
MATAIATVQAESGERAVLGIGRGDSALAHLGLSPAPVPFFARYLKRLQGYLRGEEVAFDVDADGGSEVLSADALNMASAPTSSRLHWLRPTLAKVPVDVAATGPKVIAIGATLAERVTFAVGANTERLTWGIATAHAARIEAGLDPHALGIGAYVPVLVHPNRDLARKAISGGVASFARFSVMHGSVAGPVPEGIHRTLLNVHAAYDMRSHFTHGSPQSQQLTDEVIDTFGIAGPSDYCIERLQQLIELGVSKIFVMGGGFRSDPEEASAAHRRLVDEVLPALR